MREIKFRAWDKISKVMGKWDSHHKVVELRQMNDVTLNVIFHKIELSTLIGNPNYELMQFTGLKDKNGKEIYEGDMLVDYAGRKGIVPPIVPVHRFYSLDYQDYKDYLVDTDWMSWSDNDYEVIGNIYENPELLEENND